MSDEQALNRIIRQTIEDAVNLTDRGVICTGKYSSVPIYGSPRNGVCFEFSVKILEAD